MRRRNFMLASAAGAISTHSLFAAPRSTTQYGDFRGRFIYDGKPPRRKPIEITQDKNALGDLKLFDESLVVHQENRGIANICVWMVRKRGDDPHPVHPSYALISDRADAVI